MKGRRAKMNNYIEKSSNDITDLKADIFKAKMKYKSGAYEYKSNQLITNHKKNC